MATITATITEPRANYNTAYRIFWEQINQDDTGGSTAVPHPIKHATAVFQGTFDTGTYTLQGSVDGGTTFHTIKDINGNSVAATANAIFEFKSNVAHLQVAVAGGTTEDVDVYVDIV